MVFSIEQFLAPVVYRQKGGLEYQRFKNGRIPLESSFF